MRRFCARCGVEESEETPIISSLCVKCYVELKNVIQVPSTVDIHVCGRCGALHIGGRWYYPQAGSEAREIVETYLKSLARPGEDVELESVAAELDGRDHGRAKLISIVKVGGRYRHRLETLVYINWVKRLCPTCFKRAGKSFEAVVQIRFIHSDKSLEIFKNDVVRLFHDYITEIEEKPNGYDIKVASRGIAKKIADMAKRTWRNVKVVESFGDVRIAKDGSRRAKLYISVRVANLQAGDYVVVNGKAYTVKLVDDAKVVLVDSDGVEVSMDLPKLLSLYERSKAKSG